MLSAHITGSHTCTEKEGAFKIFPTEKYIIVCYAANVLKKKYGYSENQFERIYDFMFQDLRNEDRLNNFKECVKGKESELFGGLF